VVLRGGFILNQDHADWLGLYVIKISRVHDLPV
jgi:hypothetical protein